MFYKENEISRVESILESDEASKHIVALDDLVDEDLPSPSEMLEDCMSYYRKKSMYISDAILYKDGEELGEGLAIEVENENRDGYYVHAAAVVNEGRVPSSLFDILRSLAFSGYILRESKDKEIIKVNLKGDEE